MFYTPRILCLELKIILIKTLICGQLKLPRSAEMVDSSKECGKQKAKIKMSLSEKLQGVI